MLNFIWFFDKIRQKLTGQVPTRDRLAALEDAANDLDEDVIPRLAALEERLASIDRQLLVLRSDLERIKRHAAHE